jgi:hypothetical protein
VDQTGGNPGKREVRNQTPQIQRRSHDRVPTGRIGTLTPEGLQWFGCSGEIFPARGRCLFIEVHRNSSAPLKTTRMTHLGSRP